MPTSEVKLGISPAGTDLSEVSFDTAATLGGDGSFSGSLDASDLAAGEYDVWAQACFAANCGVSAVAVTI